MKKFFFTRIIYLLCFSLLSGSIRNIHKQLKKRHALYKKYESLDQLPAKEVAKAPAVPLSSSSASESTADQDNKNVAVAGANAVDVDTTKSLQQDKAKDDLSLRCLPVGYVFNEPPGYIKVSYIRECL